MTLTQSGVDCTIPVVYSSRLIDVTDCVDDDFETVAEKRRLMKWEINRLDTFKTWPAWSKQRPDRLAEAGLYYTGVDDRVQCPFCYGVLKKWQNWDVPLFEHEKHFPQCPFIQGREVGNIPIGHENVAIRPVENFAQSYNQAINILDFTKGENRLATFVRWPLNLSQTPDSLARAGFHHIPCDERKDRVQCAYCHGKLYNWTLGDDPLTEHARCFPNCPYIKLCVDESVIRNLQAATVYRRDTKGALTSATCVTEATVSCHDDVTSFMTSHAAQAVLEMGFPAELLRKVLEKYSVDGKRLRLTSEQLVCEVLELQEQEHPKNTTELTCSNARRPRESKTSDVCCAHGKPDRVSTARKGKSALKNTHMCRVCMEDQVKVTFLPCGHLACCVSCSMALSECPVCRTSITGCVRTYF